MERLFEAAIELPPEDRFAFVEEQAAEDPPLRAGVLALIRAHERAAGVLEREPGSRASGLLDGVPTVPKKQAVLRDERIGPYRVLAELGRGGMGLVYLAERDDGQFRRRVALKVIRSEAGPELEARMIAERQILASLDHPGIAKLLDGGVSEGGRPYLVMEHVAGLPVDLYCDRMRLGVEQRLQLFLTVVRAVEHAHNNLIVHRDLKPSNILVTPDGRVKLLDFGIAKLLNPSLLGVESPVTRPDERVMTPEYSSPEQLRGETLTTASDVYSLGVVLYLLLTGHLPHPSPGPAHLAVTAALQSDPERPSSCAGRSVERSDTDGTTRVVEPAALAADRSTTPDRLRRTLRGDLDAIVLRALRKEPSRRYASAALLAQDIEAYLTEQPVLAHRGSRWYRAQKLVSRHKTSAAAVAVVLVSLLLGGALVVWQAGLARQERDRATAALAEAERSLGRSEEVTGFLLDLFRTGDPLTSEGAVTAWDLLQRGVARADLLSGDPRVQARLLDVMGRMHHSMGRYDEAAELLTRALDVRRAELGPDHLEVAESLLHLARVQRTRAREAEAARLTEDALRIRRQALPPDHPAIAEAVHDLGWLRTGPEQERLYREALAIYARSDPDVEKQVGLMQGLATNLRRQGRFPESVTMDRQALQLAERRLGPEHIATGNAMVHLADQVRDLEGNGEEAERLYRAGLAIQERREGPNGLHLVHGLHSLAELLARRGEHAEAEALARRSLAIRLAATGPDHPGVAGERAVLARLLSRQGRAEAVPLAREAIALYERLLGSRHPSYEAAIANLAAVLDDLGRPGDAADLLLGSIERRDRAGDEGIPVAEGLRALGQYMTRAGRPEEAEGHLLRSLAMLEASYGTADHPNVQATRHALFELYTAWNRPDDAALHQIQPASYTPY